MDELRESSLLFSLESLLETERERVQREGREAQKRRDDELKRVAELAERRRVAIEQERAARARRVALEQERERLEQERMDAMTRATVERARIEAEGQLRIVEVEQARKHDLALARIREDERSAQHRTISWLSMGGLASVVAASAFAYLGLVQPAHARQEQHLQTLLTTSEQKRATTQRDLDAERVKNRELVGRVEQLRVQIAQTAQVASQSSPAVNKQGGKKPHPPLLPPGRAAPDCPDDGDPLKGCLGRRR